MAATPRTNFITLDEYSRLPDETDYRDELIEGELVLSPFAKAAHAVVIRQIRMLIEGQLPDLSEQPMVVLTEAGWNLDLGPGRDSVPGPDIIVITEADRITSIQQDGWLKCKPLFVIEVTSPSERKRRRLQKIGLYLEAGAGAVVEVDYTKRRVLIHRPDEDVPEVIEGDGSLVWPFRATLKDIFTVLDA